MGLLDRLSEGADKVVKQVGEALGWGKSKVEGLQLEMQLDSAAKKLGYLDFDAHRGRAVDSSAREKLLADMSSLEEQIAQKRAGQPEKAPASPETPAAAPTEPPRPVAETEKPLDSPIPGAEK